MSIRKAYSAHLKAGDAGHFSAIVSVFGNVDLVGDRCVRGCFEKDLMRWRALGDPIPVIYSHSWQDPTLHIGRADAADCEETDAGLLVRGTIDLDTETGAHIFRLMKERRLKEWSFAYDVVRERKASDGANELLELRIIEVGPTLKGANPLTQTLVTKSIEQDLREELVAKGLDPDLVAAAFNDSPQDQAARTAAERAREARERVKAACEALTIGGPISEADRTAREEAAISTEMAKIAARDVERGDGSTVWMPSVH